ncbi:Kinesin-like protein KIFC3, partial [Exaiptasia diaphana]
NAALQDDEKKVVELEKKIKSLEEENAALQDVKKQVFEQEKKIQEKEKKIERLEEELEKERKEKKELIKEILKLKGNLSRVRPMNSEDGKQIVSFYPEDDERLSVQVKEGSVETYQVDRVFRPESTQEEQGFINDDALSEYGGKISKLKHFRFATSSLEYSIPAYFMGINRRSFNFLLNETSRRSDWQYRITVSALRNFQ